jgi:hypothetical protein
MLPCQRPSIATTDRHQARSWLISGEGVGSGCDHPMPDSSTFLHPRVCVGLLRSIPCGYPVDRARLSHHESSPEAIEPAIANAVAVLDFRAEASKYFRVRRTGAHSPNPERLSPHLGVRVRKARRGMEGKGVMQLSANQGARPTGEPSR